MQTAPEGSYAIGWEQVTLDGVAGAAMAACRPGQTWRWSGRALRLDGPPGILRLGESPQAAELRRRARQSAVRFFPLPDSPPPAETALDGPAITVTDGRRSWRVDLLPARLGGRALAHFPAHPPPPGTDFWITRVDRVEDLALPPRPANAPADAFHGMAAGTLIATPDGPVAVETVAPGMTVLTAAGEAVEVVWTDRRQVSGARLCVQPDLAPVRIAPGALGAGLPTRPLLLAPDQGILQDGPRVCALFPQGAVAVAARDLVPAPGIARISRCPGIVTHVVVLVRSGTLLAEGLALDAGPAPCPPDIVARAMADPGLRRLSSGEAAILRAAP